MNDTKFWTVVEAISQGELTVWSTDTSGTSKPNAIRGYLTAVHVLCEQVKEIRAEEGDYDAAPDDVETSYKELVKLLEAGLNVSLSPFTLENCPTNGEVARKLAQLKAFIVGAYSLDKLV